MKRTLLYLLVTIICPLMVMGQKITVSGLIMDGSTNETMPGATIVLLQPKDSTQASGALSKEDGKFTLPAVKAGSYIMRISYVGYLTQYKNLTLNKANKDINVGTFTLQEDSKMLKETEVVARLAQVEMKEDTFVYNADAFRLPEGSALEELVKKLPGAEVDDDGNIKINGKSISKIMVEGKEFFQNDTKMAMKNLPSKMIKKLKAYERKSDYSRITGIDDGEEETVLDLTVQKGMKEGWVSNVDLSYGTPTDESIAEEGFNPTYTALPSDLYSIRLNVNRFLDHSQFSVIYSRNNINDAGFPGGGRGWGGWGGGGGITTSTMAGINFAWENGKPDYSAGLIKLGGNVRYSQRNSISDSQSNSETFLSESKSTFNNNKNHNENNNYNVNANFRFEWMPDSLTNILFRPNFSYSKSDNFGNSESVTFNSSPYKAGLVNPLEQYEELIDKETGKSDIVVNHNERYNFGDSKNTSVDAELQVNRQLFKPGRNITLNIGGEYQTSESNSYSRSMVRYFQESARQPLTATYQNTFAPSTTYRYQGRLSYSEPLLTGGNLQVSYQIQRRFQDRDRTMLSQPTLSEEIQAALDNHAELGRITAYNLYTGQVEIDGIIHDLGEYGIDLDHLVLDKVNSQYATYKEWNHNANLMYRYTAKFENEQELRFNAGVSYQPQNTHMDYQKGYIDTTIVRTTQNWAPRIDIRWKISNTSQLRLRYNGRMSQPSMTDLIETVDSSDPLNITTGNAGLKSSWTDNFNLFYNGYNTEAQRGWSANLNGNISRRTIESSTIYDEQTGARYTRPMNIDGDWNIGTWLMFNTAIDKKKMWNFSTNTNIDYNHNVGYISSDIDDTARKFLTSAPDGGVDMNGLFSYAYDNDLLKKSTTKTLNVRETLRFNVRGEIGATGSYEIGVNGSGAYRHDRNSIQSNANLDTWTFNYGGNIILNFPWGMALSTDIGEQCRRGYEDANMNTNELIWNAQLSQSFLKGRAATISVQWYDILKERSNISRNINATMRTNTWTNAINSYVMVHFIYRLNLLGNKEARANGGFGGGRGNWGGGGRGGFGGGGGWGGGGGGRF